MSECDHTQARSTRPAAEAQELFTQPLPADGSAAPPQALRATPQPPDFTFVSTGLHQGEATLHGQPMRDLAYLEVSDGVDQHPQVTLTLRPRAGMSLVLPHAGVTVLLQTMPGYKIVSVDHPDRAETTWTAERIAPDAPE
jgi:hypothetical protein